MTIVWISGRSHHIGLEKLHRFALACIAWFTLYSHRPSRGVIGVGSVAHSVGKSIFLIYHNLALLGWVGILTAMDMAVKLALLLRGCRRLKRVSRLVIVPFPAFLVSVALARLVPRGSTFPVVL